MSNIVLFPEECLARGPTISLNLDEIIVWNVSIQRLSPTRLGCESTVKGLVWFSRSDTQFVILISPYNINCMTNPFSWLRLISSWFFYRKSSNCKIENPLTVIFFHIFDRSWSHVLLEAYSLVPDQSVLKVCFYSYYFILININVMSVTVTCVTSNHLPY